MRHEPKVPIPERKRQILQMRKEGVQRLEVARRFKLSASRTGQIEKSDTADTATAERRAKLREAIRSTDDLDRMWRSGKSNRSASTRSLSWAGGVFMGTSVRCGNGFAAFRRCGCVRLR
jgi:hypothetical protein